MPLLTSNDFLFCFFLFHLEAALCCCCGDTLASEIGTVCPESSINRTIHVFKWKRVPKGTNGGVSLCGTLASIFGGFIVALAYYLVLSFNLYLGDAYRSDGELKLKIKINPVLFKFTSFPKAPVKIPPQWPILFIGTLSGFFGSLIDSMLGAKWQYSGKKTRNEIDEIFFKGVFVESKVIILIANALWRHRGPM